MSSTKQKPGLFNASSRHNEELRFRFTQPNLQETLVEPLEIKIEQDLDIVDYLSPVSGDLHEPQQKSEGLTEVNVSKPPSPQTSYGDDAMTIAPHMERVWIFDQNKVNNSSSVNISDRFLKKDSKPALLKINKIILRPFNLQIKTDVDKTHLCNICGQCLPSEEELLDHKKLHANTTTQIPSNVSNPSNLPVMKANDIIKKNKPCIIRRILPKNAINDPVKNHSGSKPHTGHKDVLRYSPGKQTKIRTNIEQFTCSTCGSFYPTEQQLKDHLKICVKNKPVCLMCSKAYSSKTKLEIHMRSHTLIKPFACSECGKSFTSKDGVKTHIKTHNKKNPSPYCKSDFNLEVNFNIPVSSSICDQEITNQKNYHSDSRESSQILNKFVCSICNKRFIKKPNFLNHLKTHSEANDEPHSVERSFSCSICKKCFSTSKKLNDHFSVHSIAILREHNYEKYPAPIIDNSLSPVDDTSMFVDPLQEPEHLSNIDTNTKANNACPANLNIFTNSLTTNNNLTLSNDVKNISNPLTLPSYSSLVIITEKRDCLICGEIVLKDLLKDHVMKIHPDIEKIISSKCKDSNYIENQLNSSMKIKSHLCVECNKFYSSYFKLEVHKRIHTVEKPFTCNECGKNFRLKQLLKSHITGHSTKKIFCSDCNRYFVHENKFVRHKRMHETVICSVCNEEFDNKKKLKIHILSHNDPMKVHSEKKKSSCSVCNVKISSQYLKRHKRIHFRETKFPCSICGKQFVTKMILKVHIRTHSGIKPFLCSICGNVFTAKTNLNIHMARHLDPKPYRCSVCVKSFSILRNLRKHRQIHHSGGEESLKLATSFSCSICSFSFTSAASLKDHCQKDHLEQKQFNCELCLQKFSDLSSLKIHVNSH